MFFQLMEETYTDRQLEVINVNRGYNMVLAGPGCGKTKILAERIARAYELENIPLSEMLCLTFTNRAARGMFDRIQARLGGNSADLFVGNIHRYCSHFLFDSNVIDAESTIMDEDDTAEILKSEIPDDYLESILGYSVINYGRYALVGFNWDVVNNFLGIDIHPTGKTGYVSFPKADKIINEARLRIADIQHLMYQIQNKHPRDDFYKSELIENNLIPYGFTFYSEFEQKCLNATFNHNDFERYHDIETKVVSLAAKYQQYKERNNLYDFDDLLLVTYTAYMNDKEQKYKRHSWVQIDEIQDLSHFQLSLIDLFTNTENDFVVLYLGDEQQAIYSFMGASLESLNYLKGRCQNIYRLDKNFRSPKYLLDIYNEYATEELSVDADFLPEPKDNQKAGFYDVCMHYYDSEKQETERVYDAILPYLRSDELVNERTALLVPWNADANVISDKLKKDKISHFKISGLDSFQTVHMRTLMAHFNVVNNDFNLIAWSRILKQTAAVDTYKEGRQIVEDMRKIAMCPSDLLRESGTYLTEFVQAFDSQEIVLFDTETTGLDVFNDDIVQIAAYKIRNGHIVPNSFFNIIMRTDKTIPPRLGKEINPLVQIYEQTENKLDREDGLSLFMRYVGNSILMGHNVNYDYNILKNNLITYCSESYSGYHPILIDTLKLAHLINPRFRKYKLGYLVERLNLNAGSDDIKYHQAEEDIKATFELAKYCRTQAQQYLSSHQNFLQEKLTKQVRQVLINNGYKDVYFHTLNNLYKLLPDTSSPAITREMEYVSQELRIICEFRLVNTFDFIINFLENDVISNPDYETNALITHFSNHLMDLSTYREADLCSSKSLKEKLFVSTVHKAKGLEFENVVVMRAITGRYPHFAHETYYQQEEDKRLFYVAISRAMKRLIVSGYSCSVQKGDEIEWIYFTPFINPILHHFTVRFELSNYMDNRVIAEIGVSTLKIVSSKIGSRQYDISGIYLNSIIRNQLDLKYRIEQNYNHSDVFGSIESCLSKYGIY